MSDTFADQLRAMAAASLAPAEGELTVPGLAAPVEVLRDAWGVPAIRAASTDDLWFAQGFVTAGERLFQMDLALRAANGRLSELFADRTLAEDRLARVVGFHRAGARIAAAYDEESLAMVTRFRDGALAWVAQMPAKPVEYTLLDFEPELPTDLGAWAACAVYLSWGLSGNWTEELLRASIAERLGAEGLAQLLPPLPVTPPELAIGGLAGRLLDAAAPGPRGQGSNAWALAGSRTASGEPLLANDPHLQVTQPGVWLELHLSAPGYEARGVALPFAPGIIAGATPHHAWGITNVTGDVQDLVQERLNEERTAARHEGAWEPLTVHREEIGVRGSAEPVVVEVHGTRNGPLLESLVVGLSEPAYVPLTETYALRWTGLEASIPPSVFVRLARAVDFAGFREALREVGCPGQNVVYADVDGHIGYQCTGRYPVRRSGDGTVPVPAGEEHAWDGEIAFDDLPWSLDPGRGALVSANHRMHDGAYSHLIGNDFHAPLRAQRITELLDARDGHDVASTAAIQTDTVSLAALEVQRTVLPGAADMATDAGRRAHEVLAGWDGDLHAGSEAGALYHRWIWELGVRLVPEDLRDAYLAWREPFVCRALPALGVAPALAAEALEAAAAAVPEGTTWGELHTLRLAHPLGRMPGLESLFVATEVPLGGDEQTVAQAGFDARDGGAEPAVIASWRAVWDLADLDRSVAVLPAGVSGNPASPHWNDQSRLWAEGQTRPAPVTRAGVEAAAVSALRLLPG